MWWIIAVSTAIALRNPGEAVKQEHAVTEEISLSTVPPGIVPNWRKTQAFPETEAKSGGRTEQYPGERYASMQASRGVSTLGCRQPPASIALCLLGRRFPVARAGKKRDPGLETTGNPVNVG